MQPTENPCTLLMLAVLKTVTMHTTKTSNFKCYQPICKDNMRTRARIPLVPCETNCLTEQQKHKNNLFFIAFRIIHGKIEWLARMLLFCVVVGGAAAAVCSLSLCALCVSVAVSRPHHFSLSETNREILWNVRTNVPIAILSLSLSLCVPLYSLNTVNNLAFVRHFIRSHNSPVKMCILHFFFHFYNL